MIVVTTGVNFEDMVDRLSNLDGIFEGFDLSTNCTDGDELLSDAYECLMSHFATESCKSKGQIYIQAEVSRILSKVIGISQDTSQDATVYDPTLWLRFVIIKSQRRSTPWSGYLRSGNG